MAKDESEPLLKANVQEGGREAANWPVQQQFGVKPRTLVVLLVLSLLCYAVALGLTVVTFPAAISSDVRVGSSMFFEFALQAVLFAWVFLACTVVWGSVRIAWKRLLCQEPASAMHGRQLGLVAAGLTFVYAFALGAYMVLQKVDARGDRGLTFPTTLAPFVLGLCFIVYLLLPPGRYLGKILVQVLLAPIWGVRFVHVVVADALTSACLALWNLEYALCFFGSLEWLSKTPTVPNGLCDSAAHVQWAKPIMYALPFWIRFVQCWFRAWETRSESGWKFWSNVVNAGKYLSALLVVVTSTLHGDLSAHDPNSWTGWRIAWLVALIVKTAYCYVWDLCMDWDLCKKNAPSFGLRKTLLYRNHTWVYYLAIFNNFWMRCSWSFALSVNQVPKNWSLVTAVVEIVRRGQWLVFRLENEHLQKIAVPTTVRRPSFDEMDADADGRSDVPDDAEFVTLPDESTYVLLPEDAPYLRRESATLS